MDYCSIGAVSQALHSTLRLSLWKLDAGASQAQQLESRNRFLGLTYRSPFTGKVFMKNVQSCKNFLFVDLYTRETIEGSINEVAADEFLFHANPLSLRTWVWHDTYRRAQDSGELSLLDNLGIPDALALRLDEDAPDWSPVITLAPLQFLAAFCMDPYTLMMGLFVLALSIFIQLHMNHSNLYQIDRFMSLPFRLLYIIVAFIRLATAEAVQDGNMVASLGYILIIGVLAFDFVMGDARQLLGRRNGSRFEMFRDLGNQVYIVKWHGLPHKNPHYTLPDTIIDVPEKEQRTPNMRYMLVAVVQGILCELLPLDANTKLALEHVITSRALSDDSTEGSATDKDWWMPFCGLDVFDSIKSDIRRLSAYDKANAVNKLKKEDREDMDDFMAARARMSTSAQQGWGQG
jgi:hypothetical protein